MENQLLKVPALICSVHVAPESADVQMEPPSTPAARFCSAVRASTGERTAVRG